MGLKSFTCQKGHQKMGSHLEWFQIRLSINLWTNTTGEFIYNSFYIFEAAWSEGLLEGQEFENPFDPSLPNWDPMTITWPN